MNEERKQDLITTLDDYKLLNDEMNEIRLMDQLMYLSEPKGHLPRYLEIALDRIQKKMVKLMSDLRMFGMCLEHEVRDLEDQA